jgi:hypothetical protein
MNKSIFVLQCTHKDSTLMRTMAGRWNVVSCNPQQWKGLVRERQELRVKTGKIQITLTLVLEWAFHTSD